MHRNKKYSAEVAGKKKDGLLVIGVFVDKTEKVSTLFVCRKYIYDTIILMYPRSQDFLTFLYR